MKAKDLLWNVMFMVIAIVLNAGFSSCGGDDEDGEGSGLVGSWVKWELDENIAEGYSFKEKKTWEFYSDGRGQFSSEGSYYLKSDNSRDNWYNTNTFSYSKTGGKEGTVNITILSRKGTDYNYEEGKTFDWSYSISGNTLSLDNELYTTASSAIEPTSTKQTVMAPEISVLAATATSIEFNVTFKVESEEYPDYCTLYYATSYYAPHNEPTTYQSVKCRLVDESNGTSGKHIYRYTGSKAGFAGATTGSRIYYYGEVKNSAGETKTAVQYVTIQGGMSY